MGKTGRTYEARDDALRVIGFASYAEYLESALWKGIRYSVLRKRPHCRVCGERADQVHHQNYSQAVLLGRNRARLVSLCRAHHESIEFEAGRKLSLKGANRKLRDLLTCKPENYFQVRKRIQKTAAARAPAIDDRDRRERESAIAILNQGGTLSKLCLIKLGLLNYKAGSGSQRLLGKVIGQPAVPPNPVTV